MDSRHYQAPARAVLGPTNTGKTHLAIERMLGHTSGMIGFPLRLLARENYDRVVRRKGPQQVALLTGEEKIVPPHARYFLCTVESMPLHLQVAFLAVDEIQLCADPERGHTFTDRLFHARGTRETLFLGADTIGLLLRRLLPEVATDTRPRLSALRHSGYKNISRLPTKSAVVAFTAADVYAIAELMRRQKGGAAVVLGALSPRTRNAQVALYQAGEVDTLVATDAIGMGLNLDLNHVAFAALAKFDGRRRRPLIAAEIGQIAGRAGRYTNDGTFGVTADAPPLEPELVEQLVNHEFAPLTRFYWRNTQLRFTSVEDLLADLRRAPPQRGLVRPRAPEDERALEYLSRDAEVLALVHTPQHVRLLWEVCRIPDFRKLQTDAHPRLLGQVFRNLRNHGGQLPVDWVDGQVRRLARSEGDIDTLTQRIAGIRTWTYVSHCADWLPDPVHWQERTRVVEDRLSDALHEQLTQRFVDRRTSVLVQRLKSRRDLLAVVTRSGDVLVEGHFVGRLEGLQFVADPVADPRGARVLTAAALQALGSEMEKRVASLCDEPDDAFALGEDGAVLWCGSAVARLLPGPEIVDPELKVQALDWLTAAQRQRIHGRLVAWLDAHRRQRLGALLRAREADLRGASRGLLFQLCQGLGSVPRSSARGQVDVLSQDERRALRRLGVRIGRHSVYFPALLKPAAGALRAVLWCVTHGPDTALVPPRPGATSVTVDLATPAAFYEAVGYRVCGGLAVRLDVLERLADAVWEQSRKGPFEVNGPLLNLLGCAREGMAEVLADLDYASELDEETGRLLVARRNAPRTGRARRIKLSPGGMRRRCQPDSGSPFAALASLERKG